METRDLTCIGCPLGCQIEVKLDNGTVISVTGNTCPRGDKYARKEVTNPTRIVTTTVRVYGSTTGAATVSCKTKSDIPKSMIFDCIRSVRDLAVPAPVHIGDVLKADIAGTGVELVATKNVE